MKTTLPFYLKPLLLLIEFSCYLKRFIVILLILAWSCPLLAQPRGVWIEKQLPNSLPTDNYYAAGDNCVIFVGKNDSIIYTYDLTSGQWHEYLQPTASPWLGPVRAARDVALVYTEALAVVYSAVLQTYSTLHYEGVLLNSTSSSEGTLTGCVENMAYLVTDQYFYVFDAETGQWQSHPISGLGVLDSKYAYEELGYVLITITDEDDNKKLIAFSTVTKNFFEPNYSFGIGIERLDYGFIVWDLAHQESFGYYSAIHNHWTEHQESEYSIVSASSTVKMLSPRTVFMFHVKTLLEYPYYNHTFYIYNTLYPEPCVISRSTNQDYQIHTYSVGAQTAVISFMNLNNNNLEILSYQSDTHTMNPCILSEMHVEQDVNWHSSGGKIYIGNDLNQTIGGYPDGQVTAYAPMPPDYENNFKWERKIEPRDDWGIMLFEDKDVDSSYVYSYNIASSDTLTHFKTEWGNYSFIKMGYNNDVAGLLAITGSGYKLYFYSPVFDEWTEKVSGPKSPTLNLMGDFIYYLEPNSNLLSVFNGATNQQLDLPFGQTSIDLYTRSGENFLIAYTSDNKWVSYSAITGTTSEFIADRRTLFHGDKRICVSVKSSGILTYNAISDAFIYLILTDAQGYVRGVSAGDRTALLMTSTGYLFAFDPYRDIGTSIENIAQDTDLTSVFRLDQNYPNPFHSVTSIKFFLSVPEHVRIEIYNAQGYKIRTLIDKKLVVGQHVIDFDSEDLSGGIYFYKLTAGSFKQSKKMILLK
ncbi:MAG: T9SS type A sorting domain-containing protein [Bacteroidales bacterium]|nr:T9SS type A sorting domain-containing protein [Bacteroidales bacterium]